jgi:hypothetical protein
VGGGGGRREGGRRKEERRGKERRGRERWREREGRDSKGGMEGRRDGDLWRKVKKQRSGIATKSIVLRRGGPAASQKHETKVSFLPPLFLMENDTFCFV